MAETEWLVQGRAAPLTADEMRWALRCMAAYGGQAPIDRTIVKGLTVHGLVRAGEGGKLTPKGQRLLDELGGPFPKTTGPAITVTRRAR